MHKHTINSKNSENSKCTTVDVISSEKPLKPAFSGSKW